MLNFNSFGHDFMSAMTALSVRPLFFQLVTSDYVSWSVQNLEMTAAVSTLDFLQVCSPGTEWSNLPCSFHLPWDA